MDKRISQASAGVKQLFQQENYMGGIMFKVAGCFAVPVLAALAMPAALAQTPQAQSSGADGESKPETVVITGSLIARRDYTAESPIATISTEQLKTTSAVTIEETLNQLPQFTPSAGAGTSGVGAQARAGQASADLRSLGQQRTLVLLNGRRLVPGGADGAVDLNIIPQALIENVEVITGGASAAYGSDAITGVVNFKTRHNVDGIEVEAQLGQTSRNDGLTQAYSVTVGSDFAEGRGGAVLSLSFDDRAEVDNTARAFFSPSKLAAAVPQGTLRVAGGNLPSQAAVNAVFGRYGVAAGVVRPTSTLGFNTDGTLFSQSGPAVHFTDPHDHIYNTGTAVQYSTGDFGQLQIPLSRRSAFASLNYDLSDNLKAYADLLFLDYETYFSVAAPVTGGAGTVPINIPITNPFIPADLASLLASRPNPSAPFTINKRLNETGQRTERDRYTAYQATVGLTGDFGVNDMTWNVYGSYGVDDGRQTQAGYPSQTALTALLQAADGGRSLCSGGYNPFGLTSLSAACATYLQRTVSNGTRTEQQIVDGSVQGNLFILPAGEVQFALGADYRRNTYALQADSLASSGDLVNYFPINSAGGETSVSEVYGELLLPILKDAPLARSVSVDLGYRYSDYDTIGGVSAYKADLSWEIIPALRLRGGYSRAIRAPNLGELYASPAFVGVSLGTLGPIGAGDPCDITGGYRAASNPNAAQVRALCVAQGVPASVVDTYRDINTLANTKTSGNPGLEEETADTYSVGLVLRSPFDTPTLSRANLSIDYYQIEVSNAIGIISAPIAVSKCYNADGSNPTYSLSNTYCALISRQAGSGLIDVVSTPPLNLVGYQTSGVDLLADWEVDLADIGLGVLPGRVRTDLSINYINSFEIQNLPGAAFVEYAGTILNTQIDPLADARPRWKSMLGFSYAADMLDVSLRWRFIDSMSNANNVGTTGVAPGVKALDYFDLSATAHITPKIDLRFGVQNLSDKQPPLVAGVIGNTDYATYDLLGRRYFVNLSARF